MPYLSETPKGEVLPNQDVWVDYIIYVYIYIYIYVYEGWYERRKCCEIRRRLYNIQRLFLIISSCSSFLLLMLLSALGFIHFPALLPFHIIKCPSYPFLYFSTFYRIFLFCFPAKISLFSLIISS